MEKGALFFDYDNLSVVLKRENLQIDLSSLADYVLAGRILSPVFCYVRREPISNYGGDDLLDFFMMNCCRIRLYPARTNDSCDSSIRLVIDAVHYVSSVDPDIVVIVTGKRDYTPLAAWISRRCPRVEVFCTTDSISEQLKRVWNPFFDVHKFLVPVY